MSANKRYGRQIVLSLILTVFIILGLLYLASRFLLPHVDVSQQQVYDILIKIFPLLLGLIMIEIGVLVARRRDEEIAEEADTLPPNAYDSPFYTLPEDDPMQLPREELPFEEVVVTAVPPVREDQIEETPVVEQVIEPVVEAVIEEPVIEPIVEAVAEEVAVEEPLEELDEYDAFGFPVDDFFEGLDDELEEAIEDFTAVASIVDDVAGIDEIADFVPEEFVDDEMLGPEAVYMDEEPEPVVYSTVSLEEAIAKLTQTVLSLEATIEGMHQLRFIVPTATTVAPPPVVDPMAATPVVPEPVIAPAPVVEEPVVVEPVVEPAVVEPTVITKVVTAPAVSIDMQDFDTVLAHELKTAQDLDYDLTIAVVTISEGPVARITDTLVNQSHDFAFSFIDEDENVSLILPFYNKEEAQAFTLPLVERCERDFAPAVLQLGFASRDGRTLEPAVLVEEAGSNKKNFS